MLLVPDINQTRSWRHEVHHNSGAEANRELAGEPVAHLGGGESDTAGVAGTTAGEQPEMGGLSATGARAARGDGAAKVGQAGRSARGRWEGKLGILAT